MTYLQFIHQGTIFANFWKMRDHSCKFLQTLSKDFFWHFLNLQWWFWLFKLSFWLFDFPGSGFWHFPFSCSFLSGFLCFSSFFSNIRTCMFIITKVEYLWHFWLVLGRFGLDLVNKRYVKKHIPKSPRLRYLHVLMQCNHITFLR